MNFRLTATIILSKLAIRFCRFTRRGGTSLPGKIARKLYPGIIEEITKGFRIIMVTGTNGKTTTTRIIGQILKENNIGFITNKSGANLVGGIITTFIEAVNIKGICTDSTALIEVDEAAFKAISNYIHPEILVVTNFFRDQLDRYGELYTTLRGVKEGIQKSTGTTLVLNADDSLCASLGKDTENNKIYFGMDNSAYESTEKVVNSDAMFCLYCKTKYTYSSNIYGHLGNFHCPNCGYEKPATDITCTRIEELTPAFTKIEFTIGNSTFGRTVESITSEAAPAETTNYTLEPIPAQINLPGLYNVYNALAAIACGTALGLSIERTLKAVSSFECGFGRMETIHTDNKTIKVILVKNPTGFNQVLSFLLTEDKNMQLAFLINDKLADGTDISWLWDVDFEKLQDMNDRLDYVYTSGIRAEDMAVRLKYAGIYANKIDILKSYKELIDAGIARTPQGHSFYILPTYTAMLDIRRLLKRRFGLKEFWK